MELNSRLGFRGGRKLVEGPRVEATLEFKPVARVVDTGEVPRLIEWEWEKAGSTEYTGTKTMAFGSSLEFEISVVEPAAGGRGSGASSNAWANNLLPTPGKKGSAPGFNLELTGSLCNLFPSSSLLTHGQEQHWFR